MTTVSALCSYPVKGFGAISMDQVHLDPGAGMPLDRLVAITHGNSAFDYLNPQWITRRNFAVVAHSPALASVRCQLGADAGQLQLQHEQAGRLVVTLDSLQTDRDLGEFLNELTGSSQPPPYALVKLAQGSLTDSPDESISIMNRSSLVDLSTRTGLSLSAYRFRGNLWVDDLPAWDELSWIGQTFAINDVRLKVIEPIERCAAIDANPQTGQRDAPVLRLLHQHYQHVHFGVLAEVLEPGEARLGDRLQSA